MKPEPRVRRTGRSPAKHQKSRKAPPGGFAGALIHTHLAIKGPELLIGQGGLLWCDTPRGQELAAVLVEQVECIDEAKDLELLLHSVPRDVLLDLLDEPGRSTSPARQHARENLKTVNVRAF